MSEFVCVCEMRCGGGGRWARRRRRRRRRRADEDLKTRTPHNDVGNNHQPPSSTFATNNHNQQPSTILKHHYHLFMWQLVSSKGNHTPLIYRILPFRAVANSPLKGPSDGFMDFLSPGALRRESYLTYCHYNIESRTYYIYI